MKADVGHTLRFEVTAKNSDGSTKALSNGTQEIPGSASEPVASAQPTVSGNPAVGEKLTAARGTWQGTQPISYEYRWQTCNAADTTCTNTGAKGTVYTVGNDDWACTSGSGSRPRTRSGSRTRSRPRPRQ